MQEHLNYTYIEPIEAAYLDEKVEMLLCTVFDSRPEAWKHYIQDLTEKEYQLLQNQRTPAAKNSFCLGKIAAKKAISTVHQQPLNNIAIEHGVFGFPVIQPDAKGIQVSIAHTSHSGIAVCFNEKYPVGIDIEELSPAHNTTIKTALTEKEIRLTSGMPDTLYCHIIWSAKEALSKAVKTGFLLSLPLFEVKSVNKKENYYKIDFENFSLFTGIVFQLREYIVALVVPARLTVNTDFIDELMKQTQTL
jgi:4'-phosphopantetheinyl transferase